MDATLRTATAGIGGCALLVHSAGSEQLPAAARPVSPQNGRDLYDLCAVANAQPGQIRIAEPFMVRHGRAFLDALSEREQQLQRESAAIDSIGTPLDFHACVQQAQAIVRPLL